MNTGNGYDAELTNIIDSTFGFVRIPCNQPPNGAGVASPNQATVIQAVADPNS